jgi:hypothetical protein
LKTFGCGIGQQHACCGHHQSGKTKNLNCLVHAFSNCNCLAEPVSLSLLAALESCVSIFEQTQPQAYK